MPKKLNKPRVLGVLAGADLPGRRLAEWAKTADIILAADGGANRLRAMKITPDAVVGDLDSITKSTMAAQRRVIRDDDQNSSDCDKLLAFALEEGYEEISLVGVEGDLLDHVLGALSSAVRSPIKIRLILRKGVAWMLKPVDTFQAPIPPGARVSLIPIEPCTGVSLSGVQWPLENANLRPSALISLSNKATGTVSATLESGAAVLFAFNPSLTMPFW